MFRVLYDPALDGPTNMARDEALMHGVESVASPPTIRLYQWAAPTLSLGYFQPPRQGYDGPVIGWQKCPPILSRTPA